MGFLDFLKFRRSTREDNIKEIDFNPPVINVVNPFNPIGYDGDIDPLPIEYSDKGVYRVNSKKNPWKAQLTLHRKDRNGGNQTFTYHIGVYPTKKEAQKARYNFIQSLF